MTLSGRQRQRIAIARPLPRDAPILILDEPTSSVDKQSEGLILKALARLIQGRTVIFIAHRLSATALAKRVAMPVDGADRENGQSRGTENQRPLLRAALRCITGGRPQKPVTPRPICHKSLDIID